MVMGAHELIGSTLYNTMLFISPDGTFKTHRKLTPTYTERLLWGMGDGSTLEVVDADFGVLGGLICWEHWLPLARAAMHARREVVHVAQWPWVKGPAPGSPAGITPSRGNALCLPLVPS